MAEQKRDYYEVLGVARDADEAAIKSAYRKLAKQYHPDMHPGDADAEAKFKEASEAYAVLSDDEKRRQYDQFGHAAFDGSNGGAAYDFSGMDFNDLFGDIFGDLFGGGFGGFGGFGSRRSSGGPMRGAHVRASVRITFEEAAFGCTKELDLNLKDTCASCQGSGCRPGTSKETCSKCGGRGQVVMTQQSIFGMVQNVTSCPDCGGTGQVIKDPCPDCRGTGYVTRRKKIEVKIPAGIDNGQSVRIREQGEPGSNGGPRGDLLVEVRVSSHPRFLRDGFDLYCSVPVSYAQAALGGEIFIDTLDGRVIYEVKAGTQTDTRIRLRGKGIPTLRNPDARGDLYVNLVVSVPTGLSKEAKEALRAFDEATGDSLHDVERAQAAGDVPAAKKKRKGFMDKVKDALD